MLYSILNEKLVMNKNYWIFSVTPPNWKVVKAKNIWSLKSDNKRYCERIRKGDLLIFYVIKSRPPSFMGVFEVVGDWEESWEQIWEDEKKAG
jgi:predicted RNA-binding protein